MNMHFSLQEITTFLRKHWIHLLISIPMLVGWTILHELAHCVAALILGGSITEFVWLPSGARWGHMEYIGPGFTKGMHQLVSLAPYLAWTGFTLFAFILTLRTKPYSFTCASTIYFWLFIFPTADTANAAIPYLLWESQNDFSNAFGKSSLLIATVLSMYGTFMGFIGYWINRQLYGDIALGWRSYALLSTCTIMTISLFG